MGKCSLKSWLYEPIRKQNTLLWVEVSICAGKKLLYLNLSTIRNQLEKYREPGIMHSFTIHRKWYCLHVKNTHTHKNSIGTLVPN